MDITSRGKSSYSPRILQYRKQVKIAATILKYFSHFLLFILTVKLLVYYFLVSDPKAESEMLLVIGSYGFVWLLWYLQYLTWLRPLAISKIQVYQDKIFIQRGKKEINIPFNEIAEIKSAVNKNIGGWFKLVMKDKKCYRFTIVLERADYILDAVIKYNSALMENEKYLKLRNHLILSDHAMARYYDMFGERYRTITFIHLAIIPLVFSMILYLKQSNEFLILNPISYFIGVTTWTLIYNWILLLVFFTVINRTVDKRILKRLEKGDANKIRDTLYESKMYRKLFPAYILLILIFFGAVYKTDINTLGTIYSSNGSSELGILPGERLWYDSRYNCTDCDFKFIHDDLIYTEYGLGKVVALPGETIELNVDNTDKDGRNVACVKEQQVPQKKIAVKMRNGKTIIVPNDRIIGKVFKKRPHFNSDKR